MVLELTDRFVHGVQIGNQFVRKIDPHFLVLTT